MPTQAIKERPILFSAPMVRAILEGRKTQTRRILKKQPIFDNGVASGTIARQAVIYPDHLGAPGGLFVECPYGQPGDRLWVRETWGVGTRPCPFEGSYDGIEYRADIAVLEDVHDVLDCYKVTLPDDVDLCDYVGKWRPSIHMPRWASRILLEIVSVRVERVMDLTEEDARAEGHPFTWDGKPYDPPLKEIDSWQGYGRYSYCLAGEPVMHWKRGKSKGANLRDFWEANPWVWVVEFKRIDAE